MTAWRSRGESNTRNAASEAAHQFRWRKHWRTGWDLNPRCAFACGLKARPHRPLGAPVQCTENGSILRCTRFRLNWRIAEVSIPRPEGPIRFRGGPQPCRVHYPWCGRWGSNPHASRQQGLSLPRLPFRHDRVIWCACRDSNSDALSKGTSTSSWRVYRSTTCTWCVVTGSNRILGIFSPALSPD